MKTRFWLYYIPCNHALDDAIQQLHYTKALPEDSRPYLAAIYPWELLRQRCLRLHILFERYARVFYFLYQQNVQMPKKQSLKWKKNVVDVRKRKLIYINCSKTARNGMITIHLPWGGAWSDVLPGPYMWAVTGKKRPPAYS